MNFSKFLFLLLIIACSQSFAADRGVSLRSKLVAENEYKKISFESLTSHVTYEEIDDPFWEMDYNVLDKLIVVVDYQDALAAGDKVSAQQKKEHDKLRAELEAQKIDVEGLLKIRQKMIEQWKEQNESTNPAIVNRNVQIQGFILPIEWQEKKLVEFLLVPFVGACIHKPAPPPNQVIYAKLKAPIEFPTLAPFASANIKGFLRGEMQSPELSLVDGSQPVVTSYELDTIAVEFTPESTADWY